MSIQAHQLRPYGPYAWLITGLDDPAAHPALLHHLDTSPPAHLREWTIGYDTLLLQFHRPVTKAEILPHLSPATSSAPLPTPRHHRIPVHYNGPDLQASAARLHLSPQALIEAHSAPTYTVRFLGFAPGFPYLDGLPPALHLPRRPTPRPRIAPGTVAIGGPHAAIYPIESPGGWHCLGHTSYPLFLPEKNSPAAFPLRPGDQLTFIPTAP